MKITKPRSFHARERQRLLFSLHALFQAMLLISFFVFRKLSPAAIFSPHDTSAASPLVTRSSRASDRRLRERVQKSTKQTGAGTDNEKNGRPF